MSEWVTESLNQLVTFQKGRKVDTSSYQNIGYEPYLGAGALSGNFDGYASTEFAVKANVNDVLMLWDGERSGLVGVNLQGTVASTVSKLTPNNKIISWFLFYLLKLNFEWIQNRRTGTGVPHVPKDLGRILELKYPTNKALQHKLVNILQTIDQAIESTQALIEKYQLIKAGLMHDLFTRGIGADGKLRPPREAAPELYQETAIGWIPKEWYVGSLLTVTDQRRQPILTGPFGADLGQGDFVDEGIPVLRIGNVQTGYIDTTDLLFITEKKANYLNRYRISRNDLLFARQGATTGRNCLANKYIEGYLINYHIIRVALDDEKCSPVFIEAAFNSTVIMKQIERDKGRGTREGINTQQLTSLKIPMAPVSEQRDIEKILHTKQREIEAEKLRLEKLRKQKAGLMHDLLTGKVQVKVDDDESDN